MSILLRLQEDTKLAMKARDSVRVSALRMLSSALKYAAVDAGDMSEDDEIAVLATEAKKRREAIEAFEKVGDSERASDERAELAIVEEYLPDAIGEDEIRAVIADVVADVDDPTMASVMGRVMGILKQKGGIVDGNLVRSLVMEAVSK